MTTSKITIGAFLYRIGVATSPQMHEVDKVKLTGTHHDLVLQKEIASYEMGALKYMFNNSVTVRVFYSNQDNVNYVSIAYFNQDKEISRHDMQLDNNFNKI